MKLHSSSLPKAALDAFAETKNLKIKIESIHEEHKEDAQLRRLKDKWLFIVTLILLIGVVSGLGLFVLFRPDSPYVGISLNGIIGLVMALAGYYVRGVSAH